MGEENEMSGKQKGVRYVMKKYLLATGLATALLLAWFVAYMTTYNVGYSSGTPGPWFADTQVAREGWSRFQGAGCAQCHSILGQQGQNLGPDLTYVGARWKGEQIKQLVRNPRSFFPNTIMPSFTNLSDDDVATIATYLETLK